MHLSIHVGIQASTLFSTVCINQYYTVHHQMGDRKTRRGCIG